MSTALESKNGKYGCSSAFAALAALLFFAVDALGQQQGMRLWEFDAKGHVSSTPAIGPGGTIFFGAGTNLFALTPNNTVQWKYGAAAMVFSSPALSLDGSVLFGCLDKNLYCVDSAGKLKWKFATGDRIYSSPAIDAEGIAYIGSDDGFLYAVKPNGSLKWKFQTDGYVRSSPSLGADGTVYFGSWDRLFYAVNPDGTPKWSFETGHYIYSSPAIGSDGTIYFGSVDKKLYALSPDGSKKWDFATTGHIYSSPSLALDGTVYIGSWDNRVYAVDAKGALKWSFPTGDLVQSSPAVGADGAIYIGSDESRLYAINPDGSKRWAYITGSLVRSSPVLAPDGTVYCGAEDSKLYAIRGAAGPGLSAWPGFRADARHRARVLLVILQQPQSQMLTVHSNATFQIVARGAGPLSYQWRLKGTNLTAANGPALSITNIEPANAGEYTVVVSNTVETLISAPANLSVIMPPVIVTQPQNQTITAGGSVTFSVVASSLGPLNYQWSLNGTNIPGSGSPFLILNEVPPDKAGQYGVVIGNSAGSVASTNAILVVASPPKITKQPVNQFGAIGTNIVFESSAESVVPLGFQWRLNGANIAGATAANLAINNIQPANAGSYTVAITNLAGAVTSQAATLTVTLPPVITTQPKNQTGIVGKPVSFSVIANSAGPLSYRWRVGGVDIPGAGESTFTLKEIQQTNAGMYSALVSNIAGVAVSAPAILKVLVPPGIAQQPLSATGALGKDTTFSVKATGTPTLQYSWHFNGGPGVLDTNDTLVLRTLRMDQAGKYTVIVTNTAGAVTSSPAILVIPRSPSVWERFKGLF
jgi:outer membrane protein assembly factor BamB